MDAPTGSSTDFRELFAERGPLFIALIAVVIGLCLLCVFAVLLIRGDGVADVVDGEAPTPFPSPVAAQNDVIIAGISGSTPISLPLTIPTTLRVGGETFTVRSEPIGEDGVWDPDVTEQDAALWVYGSLINYIVGLPDTGQNRELLENLGAGQEIQLAMRSGNPLTFSVTNREVVASNRTDIFAQNMPGITLILLRASGDERLVVQGDYVVDPTAGGADGGPDNVVELGETAQLDDLRLTVAGASSLFDRPEAPSGFAFYLVDFEVQNVGVEPIDLSAMRFVLLDDLGNQYARSGQASQLGAHPPPSGTLLPNESRQATAGYQIPIGLSSPTLTWVAGREGSGSQVRVTIPFAGGSDAAGLNATITLQGAEVSADGTSLNVVGEIGNNGQQPLVVSESQVSLTSNGTLHLMLSTSPAFPWVVPPGQTIPFSVSFQRPAGNQAILTLLNQPFQLSGLR